MWGENFRCISIYLVVYCVSPDLCSCDVVVDEQSSHEVEVTYMEL
jgi:hypothetical protein